MGRLRVCVAVALGVVGSAPLMAAPVLPYAANVMYSPAPTMAGEKIGSGARVGVAHSKNSSDIVAGAALALAVLGGAAAGAGIYSGVHSGHNEASVSP